MQLGSSCAALAGLVRCCMVVSQSEHLQWLVFLVSKMPPSANPSRRSRSVLGSFNPEPDLVSGLMQRIGYRNSAELVVQPPVDEALQPPKTRLLLPLKFVCRRSSLHKHTSPNGSQDLAMHHLRLATREAMYIILPLLRQWHLRTTGDWSGGRCC